VLFQETPLAGAYVIELKNGATTAFFRTRLLPQRIRKGWLVHDFVQINNSLSVDVARFRACHYQLSHMRDEVVRCIRGALGIASSILRPESATSANGLAKRFSVRESKMMYVPKGFGHGLSRWSPYEAFYLVDEFYNPASEARHSLE